MALEMMNNENLDINIKQMPGTAKLNNTMNAIKENILKEIEDYEATIKLLEPNIKKINENPKIEETTKNSLEEMIKMINSTIETVRNDPTEATTYYLQAIPKMIEQLKQLVNALEKKYGEQKQTENKSNSNIQVEAGNETIDREMELLGTVEEKNETTYIITLNNPTNQITNNQQGHIDNIEKAGWIITYLGDNDHKITKLKITK